MAETRAVEDVTQKRRYLWMQIRLFGVPVYVHWSFLLGGVVISLFAQRDLYVICSCCSAYFLLILVHEAGHAIAAKLLGWEVTAIVISGLGGSCRTKGARTVGGALFLYSAGLLAQAVLFAASAAYIAVFGWPKSTYFICLINTFTFVNAFLFIMNLIPMRSSRGIWSDGAMLWKLTLHKVFGRPNPLLGNTPTSVIFAPETSLLSIAGLRPSDFTVGVEILNDDTTPMDFVVETFERRLEMTQQRAIELMMRIHKRGGLLWPTSDLETARQIEKGVAEDNRVHGRSLICRVVDASEYDAKAIKAGA